MGSSCCRAESPCGSVEERSVLLKDDSKAVVPTGKRVVVDTCGPEGDIDIRKTPEEANMKVEVKAKFVQVKQIPEVAETEPNNTHENRPLQKEVIQTATPSLRKGSELEENNLAQDKEMKNGPADSGQTELLHCTLNSPQEEHATAHWEVFTATNAAPEEEENPAAAQDKVPESSLLTCPENLTDTTRKHITSDTTSDNDDDSKITVGNAVAEPTGESSQNEVLSVPNTHSLTAAACRLSPICVVGQEVDKDSQMCAVTEDSGSSSVCKEAGSEVIKCHDVERPGSEPTGLNHSAEDRDSTETTAPADASESSKSDQDAKQRLEHESMSLKAVTSLESSKQDIVEDMMLKGQDKDGDVPKAEEDDDMKEDHETKEDVKNAPSEAETQAGKDAESQEVTAEEEQLAGRTSADVKDDTVPVAEREDAEDGLGNSEEDLYRGAEELSASQNNKSGPPSMLETTLLKVEDRCSLAPAVDILSYSEREWKGNTAKSALIRKGYKEISQRFGSLRRVRGDNYCALRATLFQVLSHCTQLPSWLQEEDITMLPKHLEAQEGLISQWTFPGECLQGDGTGDAPLQLKGYMERLQNKWQAAVDCSSAVERQQLCERVFQGGEEELALLEALKLLMLSRAVELHSCMQGGGDVPLFCWLLFARDSSDCPRSFLSNHLSHVGLSAGLEQVEMFLLGYALQCTIQVYRLYKADTEEFVTYYPDDHKDDWLSVCLVTEDDRHYNVPVMEAAEQKELDSS